MVQTRDKELARDFDDLKRSQAISQLALSFSLGLVTAVELGQFSTVTQAMVGYIKEGAVKRDAGT